MKKTIALAAAVLLALALCGCRPKTEPQAAATPAPSQGAITPARTAEAAPAEKNTVVFRDGALEGSSFNWEYFRAKVKAGHRAELKLKVLRGEEENVLDISYAEGAFTLARGEEMHTYSQLVELEAEQGSFFVLTDDAELTAGEFFDSVEPSGAAVGEITEKGAAIFASPAD